MVIADRGAIVAEFFRHQCLRQMPWHQRPKSALLAAANSSERPFNAIVVGEYERAFVGDRFEHVVTEPGSAGCGCDYPGQGTGRSGCPNASGADDGAGGQRRRGVLQRQPQTRDVGRKGLKRWESVTRPSGGVRLINRYNTRRRHSANGQLSPLIYEQRTANLEPAA